MTIYDNICILFLLIYKLSILIIDTILVIIFLQKHILFINYSRLVYNQYFNNNDYLDDKNTILPNYIYFTGIFP